MMGFHRFEFNAGETEMGKGGLLNEGHVEKYGNVQVMAGGGRDGVQGTPLNSSLS